MVFTINNHFNLNYNTVTKQTYIDQYDKSLKLPFVKVMLNNMPHFMTVNNDVKADVSELAVSDNIELSSAVTGAANVNDADSGGANINK